MVVSILKEKGIDIRQAKIKDFSVKNINSLLNMNNNNQIVRSIKISFVYL